MQKIDLTGQTFGHLKVLYEVPKELRRTKKKVAWMCQCDCGNEVIVSASKLRGGDQLSCGHSCPYYKQHFIKDLTGQKFGLLTAIKDTGKRQCGAVIWECKCDCGNIREYPRSTLVKGRALSCGCLKESYGEYKISQLLQEFGIPYEREKKFETCRFKDSNVMARFDFYVDNSYLIEFDGFQHFAADNYKWNTEEKLIKTKEHDAFKNQWCKENGIPLIRIPYTQLDKLTIDDLKLDTTNFLET